MSLLDSSVKKPIQDKPVTPPPKVATNELPSTFSKAPTSEPSDLLT